MEANRGSLIIYKDAETVIKLESDVEFNVNDHSMIPKSELSDIGAKKRHFSTLVSDKTILSLLL